MITRPPYNGLSRKMVLAFDIGTTFSGVSYSILEPGQIPEIRGVMRFPGKEDSKIPTVLYYDQKGNVRAAGAEAVSEGIEEQAEDENWTKSEWFKLHLRPKTNSTRYVTNKIVPLPKGKSAIDVFADFLQYLYKCTRTYIEEAYPDGATMWTTLTSTADFVLTHPNGWEGAQQNLMRKAAITAGLILDTPEGHSRLVFVSEGEASLHFCIQKGLTNDAIKSGKGIIVVDAGGGTIDISTYKQKGAGSKNFQEIAASQCYFKGSLFVTAAAENFLEDFLSESKYLDDVPHIARCFDRTTKLGFRNPDDRQFIKFGGFKDKDLNFGIRLGQIKLLGSNVASFFAPSIECIKASVNAQCANSKTQISTVFLVGGFAASDYLYAQLKDALSPCGFVVSRPESHANKAVADGAVSFHIDHFVTDRISKFAVGIKCSLIYDPNNPEHVARSAEKYVNAAGEQRLSVFFDVILPKNVTVFETKEFRHSFESCTFDREQLKSIRESIICYRGLEAYKENSCPIMDKEPKKYTTLCTVQGDTSRAQVSSCINRNLQTYYRFGFDVVLSFGLTELKACIVWKENGIEKRSPAELIYDPDTTIDDD